MDYRELLKRYIEWVGMSEGTDFLEATHKRHEPYTSPVPLFSDEEWGELNRLSSETMKRKEI